MIASRWSELREGLGTILLSFLAGGIPADGAAAAPPPSEKWCAWLGEHAEPSPQQDQAEERLVAGLFSQLPLGAVQEILVEREVRRDYLRTAALIRNRPHWQRVAPTAFRREAVVWDTDRDPLDVVLRSTRALLADLQRTGVDRGWAARDHELADLEAGAAAVAPERRGERFAIYRRVCALRREIAFANPLLDFRRIVFTKHRLAVANHMCDQYYGNFARAGGGLFVLEEPFGRSPAVTDLLQTATVANARLRGRPLADGAFLQPALSYDGRVAVFAYSECGRVADRPTAADRQPDPVWGVEMKERPPWTAETSYHLFRVNLDGTGLSQLTDGPWNDLHPHWLPDGRIVFISERRGGFGRCHGRPVPLFTLHALDADGRNLAHVRQVSL